MIAWRSHMIHDFSRPLREVKSPIINEDVTDAFVISEDVTDVMVTSIQRHATVTYIQCRPEQPLIPSDGLGLWLMFSANFTYPKHIKNIKKSRPRCSRDPHSFRLQIEPALPLGLDR